VDASNVKWLLIHDRPVPGGYNATTAITALLIAPGYPDAALDMAYYCPPLARSDGRSINNLADQPLDGKVFQRWSRHRTPASTWRAGEDDVSTQLLYMDAALESEFSKR
jgi:Prokaryotic E2 family E